MFAQEIGKTYVYEPPDWLYAELRYILTFPSSTFTGEGILGIESGSITFIAIPKEIDSVYFSGSASKTLTIIQSDGGTKTAIFDDIDTDSVNTYTAGVGIHIDGLNISSTFTDTYNIYNVTLPLETSFIDYENYTSTTITLAQANSTVSGYLSSEDWINFNAKQERLTFVSPLQNNSNTVSLPRDSIDAWILDEKVRLGLTGTTAVMSSTFFEIVNSQIVPKEGGDIDISQWFGIDSLGNIGFHDIKTETIFTYSTTYTPVTYNITNTTNNYASGNLTISSATITITNIEMQSIHTSGKVLVAQPGAGKFIEVISASAFLDYGGTAFAQATPSNLYIKAGDGESLGLPASTDFLNATADAYYSAIPLKLSLNSGKIGLDKAVTLETENAITAGNSTVYIYLLYRIIQQ